MVKANPRLAVGKHFIQIVAERYALEAGLLKEG
jgi:hypothetical protein